MANTLGIPERTLAQMSDSTGTLSTINVIGGSEGRESAYQPLVVRITDSAYDNGGVDDDADNMALFMSKRHGEPWVLGGNRDMAVEHRVVEADADPVANPTDPKVTVLFPNFDYSTFE